MPNVTATEPKQKRSIRTRERIFRVASKIFAEALFRKGRFVQSMTAYGGDRRGAPLAAYLRAGKDRIHLRSKISAADVTVVFDDSLLETLDLAKEVKPGGKLLVSSSYSPGKIAGAGRFKPFFVDAPAIALRHDLGTRDLPHINTIMLAALAGVTNLVDLKTLGEVVSETPQFKGERDLAALDEAWREVRS